MPLALCNSKEELSDLIGLLFDADPIENEDEYSAWQDWDLESANANSISSILAKVQSVSLSDPQIKAIGALLVASLDHAYEATPAELSSLESLVKRYILENPAQHLDTLQYWGGDGNEMKGWAVSLWAKTLYEEIKK